MTGWAARGRMAGWAALVGLALAGGASAMPQAPDAAMPADNARVDQLNTAPRDRPRTTVLQVGAVEEGNLAEPAQIAAAPRTSAAPSQLATEAPSARASEPLSDPSQSAPQGTERLAGKDACDPAPGRAVPAICARPIEERAQQFARPDPARLSPEQRLLVDQRLRENATVLTATRRPGSINHDPDDVDAQAVASTVLIPQMPGGEASGAEQAIAPETAEAIEALIRATQAPPGTAP